MKKAVSTAMALSMMVGLMGVNVNASAYEAGSYDGVSITMLNTTSELQDYLVDAAAEWGELTGASLDVYTGDRSQICSEQCTDPDHGRCTGRS